MNTIKDAVEFIADEFERMANDASNGVSKTVAEAEAIEAAMARIISSCADIRDWTAVQWGPEAVEIA